MLSSAYSVHRIASKVNRSDADAQVIPVVFQLFVEQLAKPSSISTIVWMRNLRNLKSQDRATIERNLEIGTQSQDSS